MPSIPAWKLVSSVCSQEVTPCYMSVSAENRFLPGHFLNGPNRCKSLNPVLFNQTCKRLWCYNWGGYGQNSLPSQPHAQPLPPLLTLQVTPGWQVICNRHQREASCHLKATDTSHLFLPCWDRRLGVTLEQMRKWRLHESLMRTICYPCAVCTSKSEYVKSFASECYLILLNSFVY